MSTTQMNKLSAAQLDQVLGHCELPAEAQAHVAGIGDVNAVIDILARNEFLVEAARVFAHALPKREAVWWACMCAMNTAPAEVGEPDRKARELAEQWVRAQTDELRRAAMAEAKNAGFQSPEAWAGVAAFWSGDSLAPPDAQMKVPPPGHLTGVAVAGAVALASVRLKPAAKDQRLRRFLDSARDIAAGGPGRLAPEPA
jgi:hypothetical protein